MATEEMIGKPTMVVEERLLLVSELREILRGEIAEKEIMQEVGEVNRTD